MNSPDRRQVLIGVASVAIAGVVHPVVAESAPFVRVGRAFTQDDPECDDDDMMEQAGAIEVDSRWHVHIHSATTKTLLHVESGLLFASDPRERFDYYLVQRKGAAAPTVPRSQIALIAYAVTFSDRRATLTHKGRAARGKKGAFFLFTEDSDGMRFTRCEDAPSLPHVTSFDDGVL
jgi:hypothetical protein